MLKLCGVNDCFQLFNESNKKPNTNTKITPPINSNLKVSSISSYSVYFDHTVVITTNGEALAAGNNKQVQIISSLPKKIIREFTKFEIKDKTGHRWHPISAVLGQYYTLYMVSKDKNSNKTQLVYSNNSSEEFPLFMNIGDSNPVAIYGGYGNAAAIDAEGSVIFIPTSFFLEQKALYEATPLPRGEKAISIATCDYFIFALSSNGEVFESDIKAINKLNFKSVDSLEGIRIVDISGTHHHCFALTEEGRVFGYGSNEHGQLGLEEEIKEVYEFTEITSLSKYKISAIYAGGNHSLFKTEEGKILACGYNVNGELFYKDTRSNIFLPIETGISECVSFCAAGYNLSAAFIGHDPINSPNRRISIEKITSSSSPTKPQHKIGEESDGSSSLENSESNSEHSDRLSLAELEIARLRKENESLRKKLKEFESNTDSKPTQQQDSKKPKLSDLDIFETKAIDSLKVRQTIGRGAQSEVFEVTREHHLALKVLNMPGAKKSKKIGKSSNENDDSFKQLKLLLQEYEILHYLNHNNIIRTYGFCFGDEDHTPSILLEFCPQNLEEAVPDMDDTEKVCAIVEICKALEAAHSSNIIHRDLKPTNILIDEKGHIKVSDFGLSSIIDVESQQSLSSGIGTIEYMAPELLSESRIYDNKVDVYSFGAVVFFILTGGKMPRISILNIINGKRAQIPSSINKISRDLINRCWSSEPKDRPSFTEIINFIKDKKFMLINGVDPNDVKEFVSL